MNPELKLKNKQLQFERDKFAVETVKELAKNPVIELVAGLMLIGYITRGRQSLLERLTGADVMAGAMGTGLVGVITAQQLSASLPYIAQGLKETAPLLGIGGLLK